MTATLMPSVRTQPSPTTASASLATREMASSVKVSPSYGLSMMMMMMGQIVKRLVSQSPALAL